MPDKEADGEHQSLSIDGVTSYRNCSLLPCSLSAEEDLTQDSEILTFPPGASQGCVNATFARDDSKVEPKQKFEVTFEPYIMNNRSRRQTGAGIRIDNIPAVIIDNDRKSPVGHHTRLS